MQTIKTAVVVVLLLGVCYGAYVALNAPEPTLPETLQDWNEQSLDMSVENGAAVDIPQLTQTPAPDALDSLAPPTVLPPAPNGPAPSGLSLPNSNTNSSVTAKPAGKSPDILTPPAPRSSSSINNSLASTNTSLGNDVPGLPALPDLGVPATNEGASVPLPEPGSKLPPPPTSLASTPSLEPPSDFPPLPNLPGNEEPTTSSAVNNALPPLPGASNPSGGNGITKPESKSGTSQPYATAREQALKLAGDGKLREALAMMSPYFDHIELTHEEHLDLIDLLDALAGEVIYSRRHFLESKFIVSPGDTLESIANKYRVSPEVLASVNRMGDSRVVLAGTELKVLTGPFRGEIDMTRGELTLFLGDLYAGRFPVSIGKEPVPTEGNYSIVERRRDHSYVGPDSKFIPANDARNPYGGYWMHLGNNICIHGSPETSSPELESAGCISLAPLDAKEVYTLLTQGSEIVIKR